MKFLRTTLGWLIFLTPVWFFFSLMVYAMGFKMAAIGAAVGLGSGAVISLIFFGFFYLSMRLLGL